MSEYIIEWSGIGARIVELLQDGTPLVLLSKRLREERRRESIVRCRDCAYFYHHKYRDNSEYITCSYFDSENAEVEPNGFCAWAIRRNDNR